MLKYGHRGKPKFCPFRLSNDESMLIWYSDKEEKQLKLSNVSRIIPGQRTGQGVLEKMGLLNSNLLAAHAVWVNDSEVISVADFYVAFYRIKILLHDLLCFYNHFYKDKVKFCYRYSEFMYIYTCVSRLTFFVGFFPQ